MGYAVPSNGNVLHLKDFSCITWEDIEECQSLMPKDYSVVVRDTPEVGCIEIKRGTFYENTRLNGMSMINSRIKVIGENAFYKCLNLTFVDFPLVLEKIGQSAFSYCTRLTQIDLPNSLKYIETLAFCGCTSLEIITIPESVILIGYDVFADCENLRKIGVPKKLVDALGEKHILGQFCNAELVVYGEGESIELSSLDSEKSSNVIENKIIVPNTEILTVEDVSKPISSKPKVETRSFNGVIRRNLIAENKKK